MSRSDSLVSIIVPVYNIREYVRQCIESILSQTYGNFELLIVDDGSNDGCAEICDEYAVDKRVVILHQENRGLVGAWKSGVEKAVGNYICFIDGDDFVASDYVESLISAIDGVDMVCMNCTKFMSETSIKYKINELEAGTYEVDEFLLSHAINNSLHRGNKLIGNARWSKLIKSEIVKEYADYCSEDVTFGEDQQLTIGMILGCKRIRIIDEYKYFYRSNPTSIMNSYKKDLWRRSKLLIKTIRSIPEIEKIKNSDNQLRTQLFDYLCECLKNEQFYGNGIGKEYFNSLYDDAISSGILVTSKSDSGSKFNRLIYKLFRRKHRYFIILLLKYYKFRKSL